MINPKRGLKVSVLLLISLVSAVYFLRTSFPSPLYTSFASIKSKNPIIQEVYEVCGDINVKDDFSPKEISQANGINGFLLQLRGGNPMLNFAFSNQTSEDFIKEYATQIAPYGLFGGLMLILGLMTLCCLCCDYKCFRNCVNPKSSSRVACIVLSIGFCLFMMGGAAAGWYFAVDLQKDFKRTSCAGANFIGEFSTGNSELKWLGLLPAMLNLTYIKNHIEETIGLLPDIDDIHQNLENLRNELNVEIQGLYDHNKGLVVRSPVQTEPPLQPEAIQRLGPPSAENTVCASIKEEIDLKHEYISEGLDEASSAINTLKDQSSTITDVLQRGIDISNDLNNNVTDVLRDYVEVAKEGERFNNEISTGIIVFFAIAAFLSFIVFLGVINTFTLKSEFGVTLLKGSRICLNLILLIIFAISIAIFPTVIVAMEGCNTTETAFKNETILNNLAKKFVSDYDSSNYSTYIHTCMYGNGDILANFGVNEQLDKINTIFNQIQNFSDFFNITFPDSLVLPTIYHQLDQFLYGKLPVSKEVGERLMSLNSLTNRNYSSKAYGCSESEDSWLLNSTSCNSTYGYLFKSTDNPGYNYGDATCMSLDQFSSYQPDERYFDKYSTCPAQQGIPYAQVVMSLVEGFQAHFTDVKTTFSQVLVDVDKINRTNEEFMDEAKSLIKPLVDIDERAYELLKLVGNNQTGLVSNFNCLFLKTNGMTAIDQLCIAYLPDLFMIALCILVFGVLSLLAMFPIYFLEKIFGMEKQKATEKKLQDRMRLQNEREQLLLGGGYDA